jgi:hypothetical protein
LNEVCCSFEFGLPQRHTTPDHWCTPEVCVELAPTVSTAIDLTSGCSSPAIVQTRPHIACQHGAGCVEVWAQLALHTQAACVAMPPARIAAVLK